MKLTEEQYHDHREAYDGYCTECDKVTRFGETEPDAEEYECPSCEDYTCCGIEQALVAGYLEIVPEAELLREEDGENDFVSDEDDEDI